MAFDFAEFFGVDASDVFEQKEQAEGFLAGTKAAAMLMEALNSDFKDRSRTFREGVMAGLQENL